MTHDFVAFCTLAAAPFAGSMLSVLVSRLPEEEQVVWGRSRCDHCRRTLGVRDLIPLVSYAIQSGRCRYCARTIPLHHPALETGAVAVALWALLTFDGALGVITAILGWVLLALAAMDYDKLFLSDYLTLPLVPAGLAVNAAMPGGDVASAAIGAALGFGSIAGVAFLFEQIRGTPGIGMGDAKLFAGAGAWTGWIGLGGILLIAVAATLAYAILFFRNTKAINWQTAIPLGPGLCLGFWLTWLYGPLTLNGI